MKDRMKLKRHTYSYALLNLINIIINLLSILHFYIKKDLLFISIGKQICFQLVTGVDEGDGLDLTKIYTFTLKKSKTRGLNYI